MSMEPSINMELSLRPVTCLSPKETERKDNGSLSLTLEGTESFLDTLGLKSLNLKLTGIKEHYWAHKSTLKHYYLEHSNMPKVGSKIKSQLEKTLSSKHKGVNHGWEQPLKRAAQ